MYVASRYRVSRSLGRLPMIGVGALVLIAP